MAERGLEHVQRGPIVERLACVGVAHPVRRHLLAEPGGGRGPGDDQVDHGEIERTRDAALQSRLRAHQCPSPAGKDRVIRRRLDAQLQQITPQRGGYQDRPALSALPEDC